VRPDRLVAAAFLPDESRHVGLSLRRFAPRPDPDSGSWDSTTPAAGQDATSAGQRPDPRRPPAPDPLRSDIPDTQGVRR
jgi:hypothetical protein